jgi:uncharacterized protein (TIGR02147 family)
MTMNANQWLRNEFCRRQKSNASYSLRSFARQCGVSPGHLSEILSDKREISRKMAIRIRSGLDLDASKSLEWEQACSGRLTNVKKLKARLLAEDTFQVIADWQHFAILSALEIEGAKHTIKSLASRFGLSHLEIQDAADRLVRLGLMRCEQDEFVRVLDSELETTDQKTSQAIQMFHKQVLTIAGQRLLDCDVSERDYLSGTVAICKANIPRAKAAMRHFRDELMAILEEGQADDVYCVNLQFFPLSRRTNENQ